MYTEMQYLKCNIVAASKCILKEMGVCEGKKDLQVLQVKPSGLQQ